MLTPEDMEELRPKFEEIRRLLNKAYVDRGPDISVDAPGLSVASYGYYIASLPLMRKLVVEVIAEEGHSVRDAFKRVADAANSPEGAGVIGGVAAGVAVPTFITGLGGFGIAAGGTAVGIAGLAGAAAATGGVGLAGAAALYLAYKGSAAALETEVGQNARKGLRRLPGSSLFNRKSEEKGPRIPTPQEANEMRPRFEEIRQLLNNAYIRSEPNISDEACGYYIGALACMEKLVEELA